MTRYYSHYGVAGVAGVRLEHTCTIIGHSNGRLLSRGMSENHHDGDNIDWGHLYGMRAAERHRVKRGLFAAVLTGHV